MDIVIDKLTRSKRRSLALEITSDGRLIVRAPNRTPLEFIHSFIDRKRNWVIEKQKTAREKHQDPKYKKIPDSLIPYYKEKAYPIISERIVFYAKAYGFEYKKVKITKAKKRWGSCSGQGNLNFTWRLIMAPLPVIDYIVVHELAHTRQRNHSRKFWQEVEKVLPDYRVHEKWLRDNSIYFT